MGGGSRARPRLSEGQCRCSGLGRWGGSGSSRRDSRAAEMASLTPTQLRHRNGILGGAYPFPTNPDTACRPTKRPIRLGEIADLARGFARADWLFWGDRRVRPGELATGQGDIANHPRWVSLGCWRSRRPNDDCPGVGNFRPTLVTNQIVANLGGRNRHPGAVRGPNLQYWRLKEALQRKAGRY